MKAFLSRDDVASLLGVSGATISNWIKAGTCPAADYRFGNRVYWSSKIVKAAQKNRARPQPV
jgi:predicted site-specific integrase-resolvase